MLFFKNKSSESFIDLERGKEKNRSKSFIKSEREKEKNKSKGGILKIFKSQKSKKQQKRKNSSEKGGCIIGVFEILIEIAVNILKEIF